MDQSKTGSNKFTRNGMFLFYVVAFITTIAIFIFSAVINYTGYNNIIDYTDRWFYDMEMTQPADLEHPHSEEGVSVYYYSKLPYMINTGDSLWMKAKNCALEVFLIGKDGIKEHKYSLKEGSYINGKSKGTVWVSIPVDYMDSEKIVQLEFKAMYDDTSCYVDETKYGPGESILKKLIAERFVGITTSLAIMLIGLILIVVHFVLRKIHIKETETLVYLGLFALATASWSFSEIKILQLLGIDSGAAHNLSCMMLSLIVLPLFLYFKKRDNRTERIISSVVMILTVVNFAGCCALHFLGISDFHVTMTFTHIVIGVAAFGIILFAYLSVFKNPNRNNGDITAAWGLAFLGIMAIADIIRYKIGGVNDSALLTRIGLLMYISMLGINSLVYIMEMVKKGLSADLIAKLAYQDGLTELGNRTAYTEKLVKVQNNPVNTIFMFDINNLKKVNDNIGHAAGDQLITAGADLIKTKFGDIGTCYRIGGDEFVCIVEDEVDITAKAQDFLSFVEEFNKTSKLDFPVTLAIGGAKWVKGQNMKEVVNRADKKMYQCKKQLKNPSDIR